MMRLSSFDQVAAKLASALAIGLPLASLLYLVRFHLVGFPTTGLEIYLLVFFIVSLIGFGWKRILVAARCHPWCWAMLAWNGVGLFAACYTPSVLTGLGLWRAYFLEPTVVALLLPMVLVDEESRERLKQTMCAAVLLIAAWALAQFVTGYGIPKPWNVSIAAGRRATGPFPFPNAIALFVTPVVAWLAAAFIAGRRKALEMVTMIAGLIAIACAKSDGGMVAFLVVVIGALALQKVGRWILLGITVAGGVVLAVFPKIAMLVWKTLTFKQWSGQVRLYIWRETWQMLQVHPWLGAGLGGYPTVFAPFHKAKAIEIFQYPHTILFNLWTEVGVLGIAVFICLCVLWMKQAKQKNTSWSWRWVAVAPLVAMLLHGLVDVPYFKNDLALLFWLLAFLA